MYPVIVADPPWDFTTYSDKAQKSAKQHYPTMSTEAIAALPVGVLAAPDCALLLWATWPNLIDAVDIGRAWGFEYKTLGFIWVKRTLNGNSWHTGLGYYTRANSEPCLLFTCGRIQRKRKDIHQVIATDDAQSPLPGFEEVITARISRHSQKPEAFYYRVEQLFTGPYCELFSRKERVGWTVMGNEIDGKDMSQAIKDESKQI